MAFRRQDWRQTVIEADPEWPVTSRIIEEYRFSAPGAEGARVFKADYTKRGAYGDDD